MKQSRRHTILLFSISGIAAILLLLADMATGDTYIPISKIWAVLTGDECDEMTRNILLSIRFIRVVVASLIGIALSVSGLQMQTVFQNPLADPYLLGVSSGAGLGVALFILGAPLLGWSDFPFLQSMGIVGFRLDRNRRYPTGSSYHQPESEKYSGCPDHGSNDWLCGRCHYPDITIFKLCRATENVHTMVNGISQPYHYQSIMDHDTGIADRSVNLGSLHQTIEPIAVGRELCPHNGYEHQTLPARLSSSLPLC